MTKSVRSWSQPDNVPDIIGIKHVDLSIFKYGTHIPMEFHEDFRKANDDTYINRGEAKPVKLLLDGNSYDASLRNIQRKTVDQDTLQLRWDGNDALKQKMKEIFKRSFVYLTTLSGIKNDQNKITTPEKLTEYIEFYRTESPFQYKLVPNTSQISEEELDNILNTFDRPKRYWVFQGNPKSYDAIGALKEDKLSSWSVKAHKNEIRKGDKFILWLTGAQSGCYALGTVASNVYEGIDDEDSMRFSINFSNEPRDICDLQIDKNLHDKPILKETVFNHQALSDLKAGTQGTNFSATKEQFEALVKLVSGIGNDKIKPNPQYSIQDLANDTGFEIEEIDGWNRAILRKKQVIFYGPPGTGKTFVAEKFARRLISETDGFAEILQFHPAYAYEDFIQGIRPNTKDDGNLEYKTTPGRFLEFCREARRRKGRCVLIIDEINRANLARVFGELMYLLEYRDKEVPLAGGGELSIPDNAVIIGTMNTADRSIALVDHALRRRFAFIALSPNYDILKKFQEPNGFNTVPLVSVLKKINRQIDDPHYEIGIAFFLKPDLKSQLPDIWKMEIEPYLEEYFFDQNDKVETFRWEKIRESII